MAQRGTQQWWNTNWRHFIGYIRNQGLFTREQLHTLIAHLPFSTPEQVLEITDELTVAARIIEQQRDYLRDQQAHQTRRFFEEEESHLRARQREAEQRALAQQSQQTANGSNAPIVTPREGSRPVGNAGRNTTMPPTYDDSRNRDNLSNPEDIAADLDRRYGTDVVGTEPEDREQRIIDSVVERISGILRQNNPAPAVVINQTPMASTQFATPLPNLNDNHKRILSTNSTNDSPTRRHLSKAFKLEDIDRAIGEAYEGGIITAVDIDQLDVLQLMVKIGTAGLGGGPSGTKSTPASETEPASETQPALETETASETPEPASEAPEPASETPEPASETPELASETPEPASETPELASETAPSPTASRRR